MKSSRISHISRGQIDDSTVDDFGKTLVGKRLERKRCRDCFCCRTPFGLGYSVIAHAYRHQSQPLVAAEIRAIIEPATRRGVPIGRSALEVAEAFEEARARRAGARMLMALTQVWGRSRLEAAALEFVAIMLQVVEVICLAAIFQDLSDSIDNKRPLEWLRRSGGDSRATHATIIVVPLVAAAILANMLQLWARNQRAVVASEISATLRSWLFRRAAASESPHAAPLDELFREIPLLAVAWTKLSFARGVSHFLSAVLVAIVIWQCLGTEGLLAPPVVIAILGMDGLWRSRRCGAKSMANLLTAQAQRRVAIEDCLGTMAAVKMFSWERHYFRKLCTLRGMERAALGKMAAGIVPSIMLHPLLLVFFQAVACLCSRLVLHGIEGGVLLWEALAALAAFAVLGTQLRLLRRILSGTGLLASAANLEQAALSFSPQRSAPEHGDPVRYKAAKYAISIHGMRFFWPADLGAQKQGGAALPVVDVVKDVGSASARAGSGDHGAVSTLAKGLDAVDCVTDDASVAERAKRTTQGSQNFDLKILSFQVKRGSAVALVGATSSGKSTLLAGLLGLCRHELWVDDGDHTGIYLTGRLAFAPQSPVLMKGRSIRDNILCGMPYDRARYDIALALSTVSEDLALHSSGDTAMVEELDTEEAKSCIQLARAIYSEAEILLFDDPFTDMSPQRAARILNRCVRGFAKDRTFLFATSNLALLADVDAVIVVIRNGTIFEQGDYKSLVSMPTEFSRILTISNRRDADRGRTRNQAGEGIPCHFLCYQTFADPMDKLYPRDRAAPLGKQEQDLKGWNTFSTGEVWVSKKMNSNAAQTSLEAQGPKKHTGLVERRRGVLDVPHAEHCFPISKHVGDGSMAVEKIDQALAPQYRPPPRNANSASVKSAMGGRLALPGGDDGDIDPLASVAPIQHQDVPIKPQAASIGGVRHVSDLGGGVAAMFERQMLQDGPQEFEDEFEAEEGELLEDEVDEPLGELKPLGSKCGAGAPGVQDSVAGLGSAVPTIGYRLPEPTLDGAEFGARFEDEDDPMPQLPIGPEQLFSSQETSMGQQHLASANTFGDKVSSTQLLLPDFEVKHPSHRGVLQREASHFAPAPSNDRGKKSRKSPVDDRGAVPSPRRNKGGSARRGERVSNDRRAERLEALERALRDKNMKIAELERKVAVGAHELPKTSVGMDDGAIEKAIGMPPLAPKSVTFLVSLGDESGGVTRMALETLVRGGGLSSILLTLLFCVSIAAYFGVIQMLTRVLAGSVVRKSDTLNGASNQSVDLTTATFEESSTPTTTSDASMFWQGFSTQGFLDRTTTAMPSTSAIAAVMTTTAAKVVLNTTWIAVQNKSYCLEMNLSRLNNPSDANDVAFDEYFGWYSSDRLSLGDCRALCVLYAVSWGCRYISWGGPQEEKRFCYIHRTCDETRPLAAYDVHRLVVVLEPTTRRLQAIDSFAAVRFDLFCLIVLSCILVVVLLAQSHVASRLALKVGQSSSKRQFRATLAAPGAAFSHEPKLMELLSKRLVDDVTLVDELLPGHLCKSLVACVHLIAMLVAFLFANLRQALLLVVLGVAIGLSTLLVAARLTLGARLQLLCSQIESAASLRTIHVVVCHDVLRTHGRLQFLCDEFESLCWEAALASVANDIADRWLKSRLQLIAALLLGTLAFTLVLRVQEPGAMEEFGGVSSAAAALILVALLPDFLEALSKHIVVFHHGLSALGRIEKVWKCLPFEELESPVLRMADPSKKDGKDVEKLPGSGPKSKSRNVAFGDTIVALETADERAAAMRELARLECDQEVSVEHYPLERVADDWPYFGGVEFEHVEMRYASSVSSTLHDASLLVPAAKATLLVGLAASGKTSLLHALLRLEPICRGRIIVDSVDVRCVGLTTLRSRLAFVPQETIVFKGSWRSNLDPVGEFDEEQLHIVVQLTRFQQWIAQRGPRGLDEPVIDDYGRGPNPAILSILGLCRALLRLLQKRSKLLVMDCTTCRLSVSSDADLTALILPFCRRREVAVLQSSRRLVNVAMYDNVAVMRDGRILEEGPPRKLWSKDGDFRAIARQQGVNSTALSKPNVVYGRVASMWGWSVNPQEDVEWADEFEVGMKAEGKRSI